MQNASSQTSLNTRLYQVSDDCNAVESSVWQLKETAETAANKILEGKQNSAF